MIDTMAFDLGMNWKTIPGPTEEYQIREDGNIRSFKTGEWVIMRPILQKIGYYMVSLSYFGKSEKRCIHRLLAEAFIPNPENKGEVNHKNGIKSDNRLENLEWMTHKENMAHATETGLRKPQKSKYTDEQIQSVLKLRERGLSQDKIAALTGINQSMVSFFILGYRTKYKSIREMRKIIGTKDCRGEDHHNSVLTDSKVRSIRADIASGISMFQCARNYSVSYPTIWNIKNGRIWKHVN